MSNGFLFKYISGGERGIRTLDTIARIHAFQACAFSHSATSPKKFIAIKYPQKIYIFQLIIIKNYEFILEAML